ncbi:competence type IV pilus minor pilin ComGG [Geomicrobium sp. JCM 19038]|uniref:competence type IV pilus minor pilin ComGG n=1 Tax=Geomicrobium sp. JCM 19038 TaxID=1460635 RepID=UPI0009DFB1C8|nr:competence type IV pilus minor pilin ComGG [Geomicrobium sp. JCM 19038]
MAIGEKGAIMPLILVLCFVFSALVATQALLFLTEKQMVTSYQHYMQASLLIEKSKKEWWRQFERGDDKRAGTYRYDSGTVSYTQKAASSDYDEVVFTSKTTADTTFVHRFYIMRIDVEEDEANEDDYEPSNHELEGLLGLTIVSFA